MKVAPRIFRAPLRIPRARGVNWAPVALLVLGLVLWGLIAAAVIFGALR